MCRISLIDSTFWTEWKTAWIYIFRVLNLLVKVRTLFFLELSLLLVAVLWLTVFHFLSNAFQMPCCMNWTELSTVSNQLYIRESVCTISETIPQTNNDSNKSETLTVNHKFTNTKILHHNTDVYQCVDCVTSDCKSLSISVDTTELLREPVSNSS